MLNRIRNVYRLFANQDPRRRSRTTFVDACRNAGSPKHDDSRKGEAHDRDPGYLERSRATTGACLAFYLGIS